MTTPAEAPGEIVDNPAPPETAWRDAAKRIFWRLLPRSAYQRLLAYSKARDFASGRFREPELDLVAALVEAGDTVVDVGANHGMWTLALSPAVGETGRVYSFEPVPFTFGVLGAVVRRAHLANVTLVNKGCSDRVATMAMTVPLQSSGSSDDLQAHLSQRRGEDEGNADESVDVSCEMTTLDATLAGVEGVSLLKLDIEGAELLALRGAVDLVARDRPAIVCEIDAAFLAGFGQEPRDVVEFLGQWGYEAHRYDGTARRLERVAEPARIGHANVLFLTEEQGEKLSGFHR
ncbi:MAG: FkbM family methyltransferase [Solirubrobacterales bacterium]